MGDVLVDRELPRDFASPASEMSGYGEEFGMRAEGSMRSVGETPALSRRTSIVEKAGKMERTHSASSDGSRRSGKSLPVLGEVVLPSDLARRLADRPVLHSRASSGSSISRLSSRTESIRRTSPLPSPSKSPQPPIRPPLSPPGPPRSSINSSPVRLQPSPLRASPRKSPGLTIQTPPIPSSNRLSSSSTIPTPPIPTKSPLRAMSRQASGSSDMSAPNGRSQTPRSASGESHMAVAGTPLSTIERLKRMSDAEAEERHRTYSGGTSSTSSPVYSYSPASSSPTRPLGPAGNGTMSREQEIRFTMLTAPSVYSQDSGSAPGSAKSWTVSDGTPRSPAFRESSRPLSGKMDTVGWGRKKSGEGSRRDEREEGGSARRSSSLPRITMPVDKELPMAPGDTPNTATTYDSPAAYSTDAATDGHTPMSPTVANHDSRSPAKSPSLPILRDRSSVMTAIAGDLPPPRRTGTEGDALGALLPSAHVRGASIASIDDLRPLLPSSPSIVMSKRSHLIREIASSERAHAKDLALVRDAYMYRFLRSSRPASQYSATGGDSSAIPSPSPGNVSDVSKRSSIYTYQTAETKRSSGHSVNWSMPTTPLPKSPSEGFNLGYLTSAGQSSGSLIQPSTSTGRSTRNGGAQMGPPVGKPLSPADMKAVFLNLDQLAAIADELATAFERACGEEEVGIGAMAREGEAGSDHLGEVFTTMVPRLRPLYNYFCARQSQASHRLMELQADPAYKAHLNDCWMSIKAHTNAWNLDSMLIKPVQRITKYPLLFDDLLACTTPVHPDYFQIRAASQMAKSMAMDIDEAKRRKDAVSNAIGKKAATGAAAGAAPSKEVKHPSKLLGLKRFRKDKAAAASGANSSELGTPTVISEASLSSLKDLVARMEELDAAVRKVGKEVVFWTAAAKETFVVQDELLKTWLRLVQLEPSDLTDQRILEARNVVDSVVVNAWSELSYQVKEQIMPVFGKLIESTANPRKVIAKRDSKLLDYSRYHAIRASKKHPDRPVIEGALEFIALHTQLVEELPALLEGMLRILDMGLVAFAKAQARFHSAVKDSIGDFARAWLPNMSPPSAGVNGARQGSADEALPGSEVLRAWHEAWAPYAAAMEHFRCTQNARGAPGKIKTFSQNRPRSRTGEPLPSPTLRHSASTTSPTSMVGSRPNSPAVTSAGRLRSSSLRESHNPTIVTTPAQSPAKENQPSRFNLLRRSNSKSQVPKSDRSTQPPSSPRHSGLRPTSMSMTSGDAASRLSWGLPQISADPSKPIFEGLGISPTKSFTMSPQPQTREREMQGYPFPQTSNPYPQIDLNSSSVSLASNPGLGLGDVAVAEVVRREQARERERMPHPYATAGSTAGARVRPRPGSTRTKRGGEEMDAAEGWRNEKVMYQCACVADFDPMELGNRKYRGLRFLSMISGDLIDVFHEVGRIEEIPSFPYPEVGVDNDGVLVGRAENGEIGLVICSFLEPLRY
ncbi:hypothetical protein IAT38_008378 [Cryptococcus sp. DSM 104549]